MNAHNGPRPEAFGLGLLRLAEPTRFGSGDRRRRSDASYPHDPRPIACDLWRAARSRPKLKADGLPVGRMRIDASGRDGRGQPAQKRADHAATGDGPPSRQRSRPPQLHGRFMAERPNELWVADLTFLPTLAGFLYLAVVLHVWSRRVIGWAFSANLKTRVVLDALDMALETESPTTSSIIRIAVRNTPRSLSAIAAGRPAFVHRPARSATPTTMRCARVSSPPSNAS
jgi:transposase InsO family protein